MSPTGLLLACVLLFSICIMAAQENQDDATEERFLPEQKRPFCNAFTGCGGKRSQYSTPNLMSRLRQKILADAAHSRRRFLNQLTDDADSRGASNQDDFRNGAILVNLPSLLRKRRFSLKNP